LLIYNVKLYLPILTILVYSAELLTDFGYTSFTVSYTDALDTLCVYVNIILSIHSLNTPHGSTMSLYMTQYGTVKS